MTATVQATCDQCLKKDTQEGIAMLPPGWLSCVVMVERTEAEVHLCPACAGEVASHSRAIKAAIESASR